MDFPVIKISNYWYVRVGDIILSPRKKPCQIIDLLYLKHDESKKIIIAKDILTNEVYKWLMPAKYIVYYISVGPVFRRRREQLTISKLDIDEDIIEMICSYL